MSANRDVQGPAKDSAASSWSSGSEGIRNAGGFSTSTATRDGGPTEAAKAAHRGRAAPFCAG